MNPITLTFYINFTLYVLMTCIIGFFFFSVLLLLFWLIMGQQILQLGARITRSKLARQHRRNNTIGREDILPRYYKNTFSRRNARVHFLGLWCVTSPISTTCSQSNTPLISFAATGTLYLPLDIYARRTCPRLWMDKTMYVSFGMPSHSTNIE